jgi:hypothetical protein
MRLGSYDEEYAATDLDNYGDDVSNHRERQTHGIDVTHCHRRRRDFFQSR